MIASIEPAHNSTSIKWNEVTWYSKILAALTFVGFVCGVFYFGIWYQKQFDSVSSYISSTSSIEKQSPQNSTALISKNGIIEIPCTPKNSTVPADAKPIAPESEYLKDAQHVYLRRVDEAGLIPDADPITFRVLSDINEFGMDAHHIYYAGCELPSANPESFKHLPYGTYATDGTHIYWRWMLLADFNAKSFESLPRDYGKDENGVYWGNVRVQGADPATFQSFEDKMSCNGSCTITGRDKNHTYMLSEIVQ